MFGFKFMKIIILTLLAVNLTTSVEASETELFKLLEQKDQEFFEQGFNQCNLAYLENSVSDSLVFFHDQSGIQDKQLFMENTKKYICSNLDKKPIRKLVPGSLSVFPLYNDGELYGAIQTGVHNFYIREKGKNNRLTSSARFTSIWQLESKKWLLTNVLSYDHHSPIAAKRVKELLAESKVPALGIGIITNGNIDGIQVYGELTAGSPAPDDTIFKVASLTKPIVAFVALELAAEGLLDLDEPLYQYWVDPDIQNDRNSKLLTTRIVLSHQTGFENWRWMEPNKKLSFHFAPGAQHKYSGEGFEYLRRALEKKLSTSIESLANDYLFEPADMKDTYFWWDEQVNEHRYAMNHDVNGVALPTDKYYQANAAANLLTTVEDYAKFLVYLMAQAEQMPEIYSDMIRPQVKIKEHDFFGLGWEILTGFPNGEVALLHTGKDPGVSALAMFFPRSKNGYVIFMNGDNSLPVFEQLLPTLYLGKELWQRR